MNVAYADERWDDVIRYGRIAFDRYQLDRRTLSLLLAHAFDGKGQADSALAEYERVLDTREPEPWTDAGQRPRALVRAGELHEARGDRRAAIARYEEFLALWRNADAAVQPRVQEIRQRVGRLQREVG